MWKMSVRVIVHVSGGWWAMVLTHGVDVESLTVKCRVSHC